MSNVTEVSKTLALDLDRIPREDRNEAKQDVAEFIVNEILRATAKGKSPVEGETFKRLTDNYAKNQKGGSKRPNLRLEGDMLQELGYTLLEGNKIKIGIEGDQAPKADGHNQISEEAKKWASDTGRTEYKRRFIPDENQEFKGKIVKGIKDILNGYRSDPVAEGSKLIDDPSGTFSIQTTDVVSIDIDNLFSDNSIEAFLLEAITKKSQGN